MRYFMPAFIVTAIAWLLILSGDILFLDHKRAEYELKIAELENKVFIQKQILDSKKWMTK